ncbi:MAG TPA: hypothetical protein VKY56_01140, partial [Chloroflexota bacterium]|nr:hypothetical protein [Chloroflexota bacterium]
MPDGLPSSEEAFNADGPDHRPSPPARQGANRSRAAIPDPTTAGLTPLRRQYLQLKRRYPDTLLL